MHQLSFFEQPQGDQARSQRAEYVGSTWTDRENVEGPPEYRAIKEMVTFVTYLKFNPWQMKVFWPWIQMSFESLKGETDPDKLRFALGYFIGALETEQVRSRAEAAEICRKYGVEIGG